MGKVVAKSFRTLEQDDEMKKVIILMAKCHLKSLQSYRDTDAVLFDVLLGDTDSDEVAASKLQGQAYSKGAAVKGHDLGPPRIWLFGGVLEVLKKEEQQAGEAKTLQEQFEVFGKMRVEQKYDAIKHSKVARTHQASRTKITMAFAHNDFAQLVRMAMVKRLMEKGWELKTGRAPASHIERSMQEVLEQIAPSTTDR